MLFDNISGIPLNAFDARAMTADEIQKWQSSNMVAMQQADLSKYANPYNSLSNVMNWRLPEKPLDERFADFKSRLAIAIAKRRMPS
jgi:hypothetical protein